MARAEATPDGFSLVPSRTENALVHFGKAARCCGGRHPHALQLSGDEVGDSDVRPCAERRGRRRRKGESAVL